jgi:DNA mismatch endonuclease, patch repair protein
MDKRASRPTPSSPAARATMQANRSRDTQPELAIRRALHRRGLRFRVDYRPVQDVRCRADIVFTRARVAIFIDGCFWHCCPEHGTYPRANGEWWRAKLEANVARDRYNNTVLMSRGWQVVRLWEHESTELAVAKVSKALLRAEGRLEGGSPTGFHHSVGVAAAWTLAGESG